ncbi:MAG: hypothetical protein Q8Q41_02000 [bacterium]|nr:hypothetical protein [bacterium]
MYDETEHHCVFRCGCGTYLKSASPTARTPEVRDGAFLMELLKAFYASWDAETSADSVSWDENSPAWGQCAVTALLVQDYMGGELLRGSLEKVPDPKVAAMRSHYWNRLPSGREVDLTERQFQPSQRTYITPGELRTREYVLSNAETARRYALLKARVGQFLPPSPSRKVRNALIYPIGE